MSDKRNRFSQTDMGLVSPEPEKADLNGIISRINTPARIRRRIKLSKKTSESRISLNPKEVDGDSWLVERLSKCGNNFQHEEKMMSEISDTSTQLRKPNSRFYINTQSTEKFDSSLEVNRNSSQRGISCLNDENVFKSKTPFYERLSAESSGSDDDSQTQQSSHNAGVKITSFPLKESQKIRVLATLLPDEILQDPVNRKSRSLSLALMFPDISGFTQLCQKYDKTGKGGPSRLTEVLNGYIGSMIQIVLSRNGDVYKFGGDAFLCAWKVTKDKDIKEIVHLAIESAVDIQKNCGEHKTDVGVKLGVKIAVSAGKAIFSIVGTESRKYFVVVGPPVMDIREAERLCRSGDVIVAPSAWKYVENYMLYSYTYHSDNTHIKVHDFGPLWKSAKSSTNNLNARKPENPRPSLKFARLNVEGVRSFILPLIMRSIDLNLSLDYLTEMRQVAIVFFNVVPDLHKTSAEDLIELSDKVFQIVCGVVDKSDGAVNKLTLFDKDIAVLVVFGLKGFKHELASQVALKCAYSCVDQLKKLKITSASAGVTTGMAYCGVIGHKLRREYTVMGHSVNMAARLMCAYENIVSSDRDTFLHSKLESSHFELLEQKFMKGIQNPGPFYKFHLNPKKNKLKFDSQAHPLLGRSKEIREFEKFLNNSKKKENTINFMVIYGEARIGKSRLVARLINIAEMQNIDSEANLYKSRYHDSSDHLEICVVPLSEDDCKVVYSACRLIFQPALGLSESSSVEEREDKIRSKLEVRNVFLLAALNPTFNVSFDLMPQYLALTQQQQDDAQKMMVKNLYNKCFTRNARWLIIIDDAEFIDEESWKVLKWCADDSYSVLYLLTIGQRRALPPVAVDCLNSVNQKKIRLTEIDKWYYAGLACQILGVKAIPVELVNLLQTYKSSGNPGWLESFLLSLLQSGHIYISNESSNKIKNMRLVAPPGEMLSTSGSMSNKKPDTSNWLDCVETFEQMSNIDNNNIAVCLLSAKFYKGNEIEKELTMDTMFIKTLDTLSPLEQLVLKAGSVLGYTFKRTALKFIISRDVAIEDRQLGEAIRNLFEIKIINCAKGDLTELNLITPRRMLLDSSMPGKVICECKGVVIPGVCKDLPQYASCGYMKFKSSVFKDTVSNLLLDDQKKKFHSSSIEFLRKNTYKCKSCNNVQFENLFGNEINDKIVLVCTVSPMHGVRSTKLDPRIISPIYSQNYKLMHFPCRNQHTRIRSLQNFESEFVSLPNAGLGNCQCFQILNSVYSALLEHAAGSGRKDFILELLLEFASVCLTFFDIPQTMQILEDALSLVNQMKEDKEFPELCTPYIYGKIFALMGATKLSIGRPDTSLELLEISLKYLKHSLPKDTRKIKILITKENIKRTLMTEFFPEKYIGRASEKKAPLSDLLSECLGLISTACMYQKNWLMAKYASLWSLNNALESNRNFFGLCTAYTNMIDVAYHENDHGTCAKMEMCAIDICKRCTKGIIEVFELEAVCQLYKVIFQARHVRAEIEEAVCIGFQSVKIASIIRSTTLRLELMPNLIFALIQMKRLSEAVSLLQELEFVSLLDSDKSSRMWYYAICLDFQLDTGFTVLPYETCQKFVKEEENLVVVRDPCGKHRLYTSLWLWCLRNYEWELSKFYANVLKSFNIIDTAETPCTIFTRLKRLEGFLVTLVHKMDTRNIYSITIIYSEIHTLMNKLEKDTKVVQLLKPRYLLLKAYYRQIRYRDNRYDTMLTDAQSMAEKMKDYNTAEWALHLKTVWNNTISPVRRDHWIEHSRYNFINWHESHGVTRKQAAMYSLPLPKF